MTIKTNNNKKENFMIKAIILTVIAGALSFVVGCGGATKEKETPKTQTNAVVSNTNSASSPTSSIRNDGDADDVRTSNSTVSNSSNAARATKPLDRDDSRSANKPVTNRSNNRGDADDRGKKDSDGDNDDR